MHFDWDVTKTMFFFCCMWGIILPSKKGTIITVSTINGMSCQGFVSVAHLGYVSTDCYFIRSAMVAHATQSPGIVGNHICFSVFSI